MKQHLRVTLAMTLFLQTLAPATVAQDEPSALEELERLVGNIRDLQSRQQAVEGEDRELYADLVRRRSPELQKALDAVVAELTAEGASPSEEALDRVQGLVLEHRGWLLDWLQSADTEIEALRMELPDAGPQRELEIEDSLTVVNDRVDELLAALLGNSQNLASLGLDPQYEVLDQRLLLRAELTAARLQKALDDIRVAERRLDQVIEADGVASLETHLNALREKLSGTSGTLDHVTGLLEKRQLSAEHFRELLLEATGQLTVQTLDAEVAVSFLERSIERLRSRLTDDGPTWIVRGFLFLVILILAWLLSRVVRRILSRALGGSRADFSRLLEKFIISTASKLVLLLGVLVALSEVGIEVGPFLAGLGVAGVVLGLALQDTLSNLFSGLMILVMRPYDVDDVVEAGGASGTVREMNLVTTTILTPDNKKLVIPNNKIWGDTIQNVTSQELRRVDLEFGCGYEDDTDKVESVLREVVETHELVLDEPAPAIRLHRLDDSAVTFIVRPWVKRDDYWTVYWDLLRNVKRRFDAEGISIPYPQRDVHVINESSAPAVSGSMTAAGEASANEKTGEDVALEAP